MKGNLLTLAATGMILLGSISSFASEMVTVDNFVRAETDMTLARYVKQEAFGTFLHIRQPTPIDKLQLGRGVPNPASGCVIPGYNAARIEGLRL